MRNWPPGLAAVTLMAMLGIACGARAADQIASTDLLVGPDGGQVKLQVKSDAAAFNLLPDRIRESGTLAIGTESNPGYPNSITKDGTNYGLTIDLGKALAAALGVKPVITPMPFSSLIPGLGAGRIELSTSLFTDTVARREAVDFLDVSYALSHLLVMKKDSPLQALTPETDCGHVIAATVGTAEATDLSERTKKCVEAGKQPIDIKLAPTNADSLLAVKSGRVDAALLSGSQVRYILAADPEMKSSSAGDSTRTAATAIAFKKDGDVLRAARVAMMSLLQSGAWKIILTQYNYADGVPTVALLQNTEPIPRGAPLP
jgi:polar amino acid transport system substrate-binding protein